MGARSDAVVIPRSGAAGKTSRGYPDADIRAGTIQLFVQLANAMRRVPFAR
jgi:hypothetical protein